ncbi:MULTISPECIES: carbohydrate kinase family protein [Hydrocarboniphaga]|jgi:fructokinase|uniref:Carbohydrate kinase PfkB domain-containing protein n=1 Tax=Hydrocarboniphaga effusa AP103 TaxID=1172194 RepID=I8TEL8_9GAMM|nr:MULTISPECIES: carbohydrate kinase [Hydrocarboniphaga]EIT72148.1 hypothetical protein WQQ_22850 [Hydrocarboniphaga effusa AP103]MDZ4079714.1 carbohydrate kinase [Hydrocarboniphaga sp.]
MFLVCGEALFDVFIAGSAGAHLQMAARPGGSPFNVAIGLARQEKPVQFFGGIANDMLGSRLVSALEADGVGVQYLVRLDAPTALGLVSADIGGNPEYAFYGVGTADRGITVQHLMRLDESIRAIHIGSFSAVVEPVGLTFETLIRRERGTRLISYDPNVRLNVEPSIEVWLARIEQLVKLSDVIKISEEDVQLIYHGIQHAELAHRWLDAGAALVVITRGERGARAWNHSAFAEVDGKPVDVIDTVGAGDTFQSAMLSWLADTGNLAAGAASSIDSIHLHRMLEYAAQAAALTCTRLGADMPYKADIIDWMCSRSTADRAWLG